MKFRSCGKGAVRQEKFTAMCGQVVHTQHCGQGHPSPPAGRSQEDRGGGGSQEAEGREGEMEVRSGQLKVCPGLITTIISLPRLRQALKKRNGGLKAVNLMAGERSKTIQEMGRTMQVVKAQRCLTRRLLYTYHFRYNLDTTGSVQADF